MFKSPPGDSDERYCPECGLDPSLGIDAPTLDRQVIPLPPEVILKEDSGSSGQDERSPRKRRKRSYFMLKLIAGWSLLIIAILFGANYQWGGKKDHSEFVSKSQKKAELSGEDLAFLDDASPLVANAFVGFLSANNTEMRNQFVLDPVTTASRMARFYSMNPLVNIPPDTVSFKQRAILELPTGRAIETLWTTTDGSEIDAVFVQQENEWRLDWDHFARNSTYPWALFLAGSGEPEGEFRLLARQRLADERKNADAISIVLYAPRFGSPGETGFQSPEFLIKRDTRDGRLLDAAFKLEKAGNRVYNVNLPNPNPEDIIRVRVKVRRIEAPEGRRFELKEVIACHWYSVDDPGVKIPETPPPPAEN